MNRFHILPDCIHRLNLFWVLISSTVFLFSCNFYQTQEEELALVTEGLSTRNATLKYEKIITDLTFENDERSYYKIYEVTLDSGLKERRSILVIDGQIYKLGSMNKSISELDSDIQFVQIGDLKFMGLYLGETLSDQVESISLRRDKGDGIILNGSTTIFRSSRTAIIPLGTAQADPPWSSLTNLTLIQKNKEVFEIDFYPPFDLEKHTIIVNLATTP